MITQLLLVTSDSELHDKVKTGILAMYPDAIIHSRKTAAEAIDFVNEQIALGKWHGDKPDMILIDAPKSSIQEFAIDYVHAVPGGSDNAAPVYILGEDESASQSLKKVFQFVKGTINPKNFRHDLKKVEIRSPILATLFSLFS